jgi:hypothetical protein
VFVTGGANNIEASAALRKNGTIVGLQGGYGAVTSSVSQLVYLNGSTDYVDVSITNGTTGSVSQSTAQTSFNGFWVRY